MPCNTVLQWPQASLQACNGALSKSNKNKRTLRLHESCAIGHKVFVHHLDPLLSVEFQAGSKKCNEGAMSKVPMMPETITPRVVAVCDAVNRSGVSSSSSASIFEANPWE